MTIRKMPGKRVLAFTSLLLLTSAIGASGAVAATRDGALLAVPLTSSLTIDSVPVAGNDRTPTLHGTAASAAGDATSVILTITGGATPYTATVPVLAGAWSLTVPELPEGTYTASVTQLDAGPITVNSEAITFTVDLAPPALTLTAPVQGSFTSATSQLISGLAGVAAGDLPAITVNLYPGTTIDAEQTPLESIVVQASNGEWSVTVGGLAPGTYTVRAEQSDDAGNLAVSASASFQVLAPAAASSPTATTSPLAPSASFTWLPSTPHVDEPVSLLSTSTAGISPLATASWATTATGPFTLVGPAKSITFTSPGEHLVRLQVTSSDGLSSTVSHELSVAPRAAGLMDPFPEVQIAGAYSAHGIHLKLLRVQVPLGSHVIVRCIGRSCPIAWAKYTAAPGHGKLVSVNFQTFQRFLPAGVEVRVMVLQSEEIGKITNLSIRAGRPPVRTDACVTPTTDKPIPCPA